MPTPARCRPSRRRRAGWSPKTIRASIAAAIKAGVRICFGTDTGVGPHGSNGEEFLLLEKLGMAPIDAIRSATTVAAETIGMNDVGSLRPGNWADLIGVPAIRSPISS